MFIEKQNINNIYFSKHELTHKHWAKTQNSQMFIHTWLVLPLNKAKPSKTLSIKNKTANISLLPKASAAHA